AVISAITRRLSAGLPVYFPSQKAKRTGAERREVSPRANNEEKYCLSCFAVDVRSDCTSCSSIDDHQCRATPTRLESPLGGRHGGSQARYRGKREGPRLHRQTLQGIRYQTFWRIVL